MPYPDDLIFGLLAIHLGGILGGMLGARRTVPAWKALLLALSFMFSGWGLPWPLAFLPDTPWLQLVTSVLIGIVVAVFVARILTVGSGAAARIIGLCGLGMVIAAGGVSAMA